MLLKNFLASK